MFIFYLMGYKIKFKNLFFFSNQRRNIEVLRIKVNQNQIRIIFFFRLDMLDILYDISFSSSIYFFLKYVLKNGSTFTSFFLPFSIPNSTFTIFEAVSPYFLTLLSLLHDVFAESNDFSWDLLLFSLKL